MYAVYSETFHRKDEFWEASYADTEDYESEQRGYRPTPP